MKNNIFLVHPWDLHSCGNGNLLSALEIYTVVVIVVIYPKLTFQSTKFPLKFPLNFYECPPRTGNSDLIQCIFIHPFIIDYPRYYMSEMGVSCDNSFN